MRYMMLSYYQRQQMDDKTLPGMFREYARELQMAALACCLRLLQWDLAEMICRDPLEPVIEFYERFSNTMEYFSRLIYFIFLETKPLTINCDS